MFGAVSWHVCMYICCMHVHCTCVVFVLLLLFFVYTHFVCMYMFCSQLVCFLQTNSSALLFQNQSNMMDGNLIRTMMECDQIRAMMEELHCTATDMEPEVSSNLHRACSVIERMTSDKCRNLVSMAGRRPCLAVFMSDGWSTDLRQRFTARAEDVVVNRTGRLRTELILQRPMIKTLIGSQMHFALKFEGPRPLAETKM